MSHDEHELELHPLKGTVKKGYKDTESSKNRLSGINKDKLKNQVQSATENSDKKIADKIQNSEKKK
jgi:anthranilate/para-aminobenzoate synthase component I